MFVNGEANHKCINRVYVSAKQATYVSFRFSLFYNFQKIEFYDMCKIRNSVQTYKKTFARLSITQFALFHQYSLNKGHISIVNII